MTTDDDDRDCARCHATIALSPGMEWPDAPDHTYCWECHSTMYEALEQIRLAAQLTRTAQRRYFANRSRDNLLLAKTRENSLDQLLDAFTAAHSGPQ
jgi:hypothetical protein